MGSVQSPCLTPPEETKIVVIIIIITVVVKKIVVVGLVILGLTWELGERILTMLATTNWIKPVVDRRVETAS